MVIGDYMHFYVLVVEDDHDIRAALEDLLRDEGYEVRVAADGLEALAILRTTPQAPALAIVDLMMPRMTGWELADAMHGDAMLAAIPILVMSAGESSGDAHTAIRGLPFFRKPILAAALLEQVAARCRPRPQAVVNHAGARVAP